MTTIGDRLAARRGMGPGFDFLRLALAVSIVAWHSDAIVAGGSTLDQRWLAWFPGYAILAMFFALSGFLIAGSAGRQSLGNFLLNRGLRMLPALMTEVALSAFVLGVLFTSLPLGKYLSSVPTWHYFTNIVGLINYQLPGVFSHHPTDYVNVSLWTIPYEYECYALMAAIMALGLLKHPTALTAGAAVFVVVGLGAMLFGASPHAGGLLNKVIDRLFLGHQSRLFVAFLLGVALYIWKDDVPYSHTLAAASVAVCLIVALGGPADRIGYPVVNLFAGPALVYLVGYLGVSDIPVLPLFHRGDYSYGIYLYGFPIQQTMFDLFPIHSGVVQFLLAIPVACVFAAFSWHCVEKPTLRLRRRFSFVNKVRLEGSGQKAAVAMPVGKVLGPSA